MWSIADKVSEKPILGYVLGDRAWGVAAHQVAIQNQPEVCVGPQTVGACPTSPILAAGAPGKPIKADSIKDSGQHFEKSEDFLPNLLVRITCGTVRDTLL